MKWDTFSFQFYFLKIQIYTIRKYKQIHKTINTHFFAISHIRIQEGKTVLILMTTTYIKYIVYDKHFFLVEIPVLILP